MKQAYIISILAFLASNLVVAQSVSYSRSPVDGSSKLLGANYFTTDTVTQQWYNSHPDDTSEMNGGLEFLRRQSFWQYRITHEDSMPGYFRYAYKAAYEENQSQFGK